MEVFSVLVTGANRGIGLEFVKQLVQLPRPPSYVFATYRSSETLKALTDIKNSSKECQVVLIKMDVTIPEDIVATRMIIEEAVGEKGLTLLINNAGRAVISPFPKIAADDLISLYKSNTIGPIMVFQEMLPLLQKSASRTPSNGRLHVSRSAVLNVSSVAGSIERVPNAFEFTQQLICYKMSKAALNMGMRVIASSVKDQGILVVNICPGWVKTDMGTDRAKLTAEESITAILETLPKLDETQHGCFMDRHGDKYPF